MPDDKLSTIRLASPYQITNYTPFIEPIPPLTIPDVLNGELITVCFSKAFISYINAALEPLTWDDTFTGSEAEKRQATGLFEALRHVLTSGDNCMTDCCETTNEILTAILEVNNTIIVNQEQIINNQTIINNNTMQQIINQGNEYNTFLEILDDGEDPNSFAPGVGYNFSQDATSEAQLCEAVKQYVDAMCENIRGFLTVLGILTVAASAAFGIALILTGGLAAALAPFVGVALGALGAGSIAVLSQAINDETAKRNVRCCMFDSLLGQPITLANFQASVSDCGFDGNNPDQALSAQLAAFVNDINQRPGSYRSFVVGLKTVQSQATNVSTSPCDCGCSDGLELVAFGQYAAQTTIIPMGNCVYRVIQNTTQAIDHPGWYRTGVKDAQDRPFTANYPPEGYTLQAIGGCTVVGACGEPDYNGDNFGGGFVPSNAMASVNWWQSSPVDTYITFNLVAPENCE